LASEITELADGARKLVAHARVWLSPDEQHRTLTWDAPGGRV